MRGDYRIGGKSHKRYALRPAIDNTYYRYCLEEGSEEKENVDHVLLHYPHEDERREEVLWADGKRVTDKKILLGDPI